MLKKLRLKMVLITMTLSTTMLLLLFTLVYGMTARNFETQSTAMVRSLAQLALSPGIPEDQSQQVSLPYFTIKFNAYSEFLASGNIRYDLTDEKFLQSVITAVYDTPAQSGVIYGTMRFYKAEALGVRCIAIVDISSQKAALGDLLETSLTVGFLSIAVFLGISVLLARWSVRPVERAWQQQRQFVADASHELKTPLTVITGNAELLQSPELDGESRLRFSQHILTESRQMRRLVESLLELARADNGQIRKAFASLDLSRLTEEALLPFEAVFFEQGMTLEWDIQPGLQVQGSDQYLRQTVDILLDNALKYGDPGRVLVTLRRQGSRMCLLTVENPGTPIDRESLPKLFTRFYRADTARSSAGSFGLGLSIAQSIVQEHGGKIWAESLEKGNRFCILLPLL